MPLPAYVFAKPPVAGISKTRLAVGVGAAAAAALARAFLADTWAGLASEPSVWPVLATPEPDADHGIGRVARVDQGGGDLGARLARVLGAGVAAHGGALAIGADSPGLPLERVREAVDALRSRDAAIVPCDDGGFALLALRTVPTGLFDGLPWSTERAADAMQARLLAFGLSITALDAWFDIDVAADLTRLRSRVPRERAPRTFAVLDGLMGPAV